MSLVMFTYTYMIFLVMNLFPVELSHGLELTRMICMFCEGSEKYKGREEKNLSVVPPLTSPCNFPPYSSSHCCFPS